MGGDASPTLGGASPTVGGASPTLCAASPTLCAASPPLAGASSTFTRASSTFTRASRSQPREFCAAAGTSRELAAGQGLNLMSSTLLTEDTGVPFDELQAEQTAIFRAEWARHGHLREPRVSVSRSVVPITTDPGRVHFGRERDSQDQVGRLDGGVARFGKSYGTRRRTALKRSPLVHRVLMCPVEDRRVRRIVTIVLMLTAVLAAALPANASEPRQRVLSVLSFNIHHAQGTDDVLDLARVAGVIRDSGADVVGLQEVDRHYSARSDWADQASELARMLGYHVVFGANIDRDPPAAGSPRIQYGTAILSRYPITAWENTYLFRSPGQEQRGLLHAVVVVRGVAVHVYDTHLAASAQTDRLEQTRQIAELIGDTAPAVLVGDLNALPEAPEIATLNAAFTDAWPVSGKGGGATYPAEAPDRRIDYVYASRSVSPLVTRVLDGNPAASDHLPLMSRLLVRH